MELCDLQVIESMKPRPLMWYENARQPNPNPNFMDNGHNTRWVDGTKSPDYRHRAESVRLVPPQTAHGQR